MPVCIPAALFLLSEVILCCSWNESDWIIQMNMRHLMSLNASAEFSLKLLSISAHVHLSHQHWTSLQNTTTHKSPWWCSQERFWLSIQRSRVQLPLEHAFWGPNQIFRWDVKHLYRYFTKGFTPIVYTCILFLLLVI